MYECKKVKQVQVQLGYGESEPKNIFQVQSHVHKWLCIQVHKSTMTNSG